MSKITTTNHTTYIPLMESKQELDKMKNGKTARCINDSCPCPKCSIYY